MRAEGGDGVVMVISGCIGPRGDGYVVGEADEPGRGPGLPLGADLHLRGDGCGSRQRADAQLRRRGDRDRARRGGRRDPVRDLLHRRDGRAAAERPGATRRGRRGRRRHGRRAGLLHGQLRASDALRGRALRRAASSGSAACGPTPRRKATPSSTRPRSSTRATRTTSPPATASSGRCSRASTSSAGAAAPTSATSRRSARRSASQSLVRGVGELAELSADEERRLLADVDGVVADPLQAA